MVAAGDVDKNNVADRLGIEPNMVVQELGWDSDVSEEVRAAIEQRIDGELLDESADEVIDVVLLWWRDGDGDLGDALVDARAPLDETGVIWVLTPKTGQPGHVEPAEIAEAVPTVGLSQTSNVSLDQEWTGVRLVPPRQSRR
ncbi:DUF3052 domain-containing protein [Haloechinothrix sp. LS1_15]|uniref:DUF3052 domain-containing protein n=1 Tax=Haloechinothrix sp. LS1_15 TaxID=2652248 RepID=UPI002944E431|nr:DUF3052 domain-containing protein [Haloechinothrix sp. LS1_15]MDV6012749.1 DUF3052 domain-containing protein [Haloechinothrix sp. LS1_15]